MKNKKIFVSPLTKDVYLCDVNAKGIITRKNKLSEDDLYNFIAGCVCGLENKFGNHFEFGDDKMKIEIKIINKEEQND